MIIFLFGYILLAVLFFVVKGLLMINTRVAFSISLKVIALKPSFPFNDRLLKFHPFLVAAGQLLK